MSDDAKESPPPSQIRSSLASPQVLAAIITGVAALLVAVLPMLTNSATTAPIPTPTPPPSATPMPTATPIPVIVEATVPQPTVMPAAVEATVTPFPLPTEITVVAAVPDSAQPDASAANLLILYDEASFTIYNQANTGLGLMDVTFTSGSGRWEAQAWGPSLARDFPADHCLRLRDATKGQRQPPAICGSNLYGLQLVGPQALFWLNTDQFEVRHGGTVIATCRTDEESCAVSIP